MEDKNLGPKSYKEIQLERKYIRDFHRLREYMVKNQISFNEVVERVKNKTSNLSRSMREFVLFNKEQGDEEFLAQYLNQ